MKEKILLGYELKTAKQVKVPMHHMIITGMTQLSGKTTTLEALLSRSKLKALAFRTKRGELGFEGANRIPIYFDEKGLVHWQSLEGLLEATLDEKIRREPGVRSAIIRLCSNASSLTEIVQHIDEKLSDKKIRGFMQDVYTKLQAYLELVLPQLNKINFANTLDIKSGMNIMDLENLSDEMQALIIAASIGWIHRNAKNTILVLPEAWKFIPQDHGSPCKFFVERLMRQGAGIGNLVWFDSQDLRGVDKKFLRQVDNWILGRQKDPHEVKSLLDAIPLPKRAKPDPDEIKHLDKGHFIACLHDDVKFVYVQPKWLDEESAKKIARGELKVDEIEELESRVEKAAEAAPGIVDQSELNLLQEKVSSLKTELETVISDSKKEPASKKELTTLKEQVEQNRERLDQIISHVEKTLKESLAKQPRPVQQPSGKPLRLELETPETQLTITPRTIKLSIADHDLRAQIILCMLKAPDILWTLSAVMKSLEQHGWSNARPNVVKALRELVGLGILSTVQSGIRVDYRLDKSKIRVAETGHQFVK